MWFIINLVVEVVIALLAILSNGLYLVTLAKNRHLQTVTNFLMASLTIADLSVGLLGVPSVITTLFGLPCNFYGCLALNCVIIILTQVSVFCLLAIAVERFIAIKYPFFHHVHFTLPTALIMSIINWIVGIGFGVFPMFWNLGWNELNICSFIHVIDLNYLVYIHFFVFINIPLAMMFFIYVAIFIVVKKQAREIQMLLEIGEGQNLTQTDKKELRAARKFALVIGLFAFCWIPLEVINAITLWTGKTYLPSVIIAVWLSHLNSALNPFVYAYGSPTVRKAMLMTVCCSSKHRAEKDTSISASSTQFYVTENI